MNCLSILIGFLPLPKGTPPSVLILPKSGAKSKEVIIGKARLGLSPRKNCSFFSSGIPLYIFPFVAVDFAGPV